MKLSRTSGATLAAAAAALFIGGTTLAPATAVAAEQVKCFGVNACKGKSDCKTANSSCKGHNTCKGKGFLEMTKAECDEKGGEVKES